MPFNPRKYPIDWKTKIRPAVLERAGNKCEICGVKNGAAVFRGLWNGKEAFQDDEADAWYYPSGEKIKGPHYQNLIDPFPHKENALAIKIVLTISHTNHDIKDNRMDNLRALCQRCHLRHDKAYHSINSRKTRDRKKGLLTIDFNE